MTNSSCAFFFSPVMARERRRHRKPSTDGVAANVMDVSVKSSPSLSCSSSPAPRAWRAVCGTLVREDPSFPDRSETLIFHCFVLTKRCPRSSLSCTESQRALLHHKIWKETMHPPHRRSSRGRHWPLLQNKVPPLLAPADNSSQRLPQSTYHCQDTPFSATWFPRINLERLLCTSSQFMRKVPHRSKRDTKTDFIAQSSAFRSKFPEC